MHATEDNNYDIPADESIQLSFVDSALNNSLPEDYVFWTSNYDSFLDLYFDNLTSNFGMNYKGSCGYVAMAMML